MICWELYELAFLGLFFFPLQSEQVQIDPLELIKVRVRDPQTLHLGSLNSSF